MRVLITTAPGYGHVFAPVPLGWALRAAGHEVVLATAGRPEAPLDVATWSGLPVVEVASPAQIDGVRAGLRALRQRQAETAGVSMAGLLERMRVQARAAARVGTGNPFDFAAEVYAPFAAATVDGLLAFAERWRPDLLVHESLQGAGPLVAARLGVPAVEYVPGLCRGPELPDRLRTEMAEQYDRFGVPDRPEPAAVIEVAPPSVAVNQPYGWPSRYVPFNGAPVLAGWLQEPPADRPRIAVTFGSVVPHRLGVGPLRPILATAARVDAEFVVAVGTVDPAALGELPANVRLCPGYLPLGALLPSCAAVIHHGGPATCLATLEAGLPQLLLPEMADQFINAAALVRRGCGVAVEALPDGSLPSGAVDRLLADAALARAAAAVHREMAALPAPAELVHRLVALTS